MSGTARGRHASPVATLARLWLLNLRLGWGERARGLHYWLGYEYALVIPRLPKRARVLDLGSGAHSVFPYLAATLRRVRVTALDLDPGLARQREIRRRARAASMAPPGHVTFIRADARALPFPAETFDAVTAVSALEHVAGADGPGRALADAARVLRAGGLALITVPYREEGTVDELTEELGFFQRHYSRETLSRTLLEPSGLSEVERVHYGERLPFHALSRRLPSPARWIHRPWDTLLSALLLRPTDPPRASAVLLALRKR